MGNPKYLKGKRLERCLVNHAIEKGMVGIRLAGSKGKTDVVIFDENKKEVYTIQCKAKKLSQNASNKLLTTLPKPDEYLHIPVIITHLKEFKEFLIQREKAHTHEEPDTQEPEVLSIENNTHTEKEKDNETKTPPQNI
jgi:hypothetical protein